MTMTIGSNSSRVRSLLTMVGLVALAAPVVVGFLHAPTIWAQSPGPKFEVASIKLCTAGEGGRSGDRNGGNPTAPSPGRLDLNCSTVASLIQRAYGGHTRVPTAGGPAWLETERYRIDAKAEKPESPETMNGPTLQALLEDRFRLKIRRESRDVPVYEMTVAKGGPKLKLSPEGACEPEDAKILAASAAGKERPKPCGVFFGKKKDTPGIITANSPGMVLAVFAENLSLLLDRPVIDKTGLTGVYNFALDFSWQPISSAPASEGIASEPTSPDIFSAVEKQLGLKLEPGRGAIRQLIVDHVERPSED